MGRLIRGMGIAMVAVAGMLAVLACVPVFSGGVFQTLKLVFQLDQAIAAGEAKLVQTVVFPERVKVKKNWVQVSGRLEVPGGAPLPNRITVEARFEDLDSERLLQRLALALNVGADGSFSASKKIKKNIGAEELMTVTLQPSGGALPTRTQIALCVDLVRKRADLSALPPCVEGGGGGGDGQVTLSSLQSGVFTPTCALAGCHSTGSAQAGLVLGAGQSHANLVNVRSSQVPGFDRVEPGNPEASYLIKKLRGDPDISGVRMPRGGPFLTDAEIARFVQWIQAGAPNN